MIKLLLTLPPAAALVVYQRLLHRRLRKRTSVAVAVGVATGLATVAGFVEAYAWMDRSTCQGKYRSFVCVLNANQGMLTFLAVVFAAVTVGATLLTHELNRRADLEERRSQLKRAIIAAKEEVLHNLKHVGQACNADGTLRYAPQISTSAVAAIDPRPTSIRAHEHIARQADLVLRNFDRIARPGAQIVRLSDEPADKNAEWAFGAFVAQSFGLLGEIGAHYMPWVKDTFERPGMQDLKELAHLRNAGHPLRGCYRSSDVGDHEQAQLRAHSAPLYCWIDDAPIHGVKTYALYPRFRDMNELDNHK